MVLARSPRLDCVVDMSVLSNDVYELLTGSGDDPSRSGEVVEQTSEYKLAHMSILNKKHKVKSTTPLEQVMLLEPLQMPWMC